MLYKGVIEVVGLYIFSFRLSKLMITRVIASPPVLKIFVDHSGLAALLRQLPPRSLFFYDFLTTTYPFTSY